MIGYVTGLVTGALVATVYRTSHWAYVASLHLAGYGRVASGDLEADGTDPERLKDILRTSFVGARSTRVVLTDTHWEVWTR